MEGNPTQVRKNKRNRGSNFTKEDELLLLSEVQKFQNIIECKMSDEVNLSEKNEAWRKIEIGFNAKNGSHRSLEQIKIKYDNIKCKARKVVASNKKYITGTGGGPTKNNELDPVIESVLEIINKKTVVGLANLYDCDVENGSLNFVVAPGVSIENASSTSTSESDKSVKENLNSLYVIENVETNEEIDLPKNETIEKKYCLEKKRKDEKHEKGIRLLDLEIRLKEKMLLAFAP
ncbi:hypothetical protein ABEB36_013560 [Hypothenemus hampei]|uniref:Regulatory protein zeste n=1 Tax=Hypothenemus hampei TaxID=57062 RepID=A0ABD1E4M0_HYPHA